MAKRKSDDADLAKELGALAAHIGRALKAAKDSDEVQEIKHHAAASLRAAGGRIASAIEKARDSESVGKIKAQARKVVEIGKVKGKPTMENVGKNLSAGLRFVSQELDALADRLHKGGK